MNADRKNKGQHRGIAAAILLAAGLTVAATPLPHAWKNWRYSRAIDLPSTDSAQLAGIVVPQDAYLHAQTWLPDIRIIDENGNEVPFVRYAREGSTNSKTLPTELIENSFAPGRYTQVMLSVGTSAPFHNAVEIETAETDFIEWVSVEASDDAQVWRIVQDRAPIFRFRKESREGTQTVSYSPNNARYLRVRILDGEKQFPVLRASVSYKTVEPPERSSMEATITAERAEHAGENAWRVDLGTPALNIREVRFAVNPAEFNRAVEISTSEDGVMWSSFAHGEIYRFRRGDATEEHLAVAVPSYTTSRYWRITIVNGNDAPLPGVVPYIYMTPAHIAFEQQPGHSYRLLYGQSRAQAPEYDLARRTDAKQEDAAVVGNVGPEEENPDYADPKPWTEKNRYFLWIVVGLAVLLLGYSAIRSLRRTSSTAA
ncbi:MAG: DUF3999 family protein [Candidatus Acidiferrales bacterium]